MGNVFFAGGKIGMNVPSVIPKEAPEEWSFMVAYSSNATFTAEEDMWIRVHCFGKCGSGARGRGTSRDYGMGGGGGNSGGYSCSELIIEEGTSVILDFTSGTAKFGEHLYATAGGSANGETPSGTVGQGKGGNKYNLNGFVGGTGGRGEEYGTSGGNSGASGGRAGYASGSSTGGGGGGGGARLPRPYEGFPYIPSSLSGYSGGRGGGHDYIYDDDGDEVDYNMIQATNGSSYPTLDLTKPMLYGGGNGGGGGVENRYYDDNSKTYTTHGSGSAGSPACIIIEKGVY